MKVTIIRDTAGLAQLADFFVRCNGVFGWDIETDPKKDYFWRRIRTIQVGNQFEQYVIDLKCFFASADEMFQAQGYYGVKLPASVTPVLDALRPLLTDPAVCKVGVNLGFEYLNFYWQLGIRTCGFFDCSVVERVIWAGAHSLKDYGFYSMEELMLRYFQTQIDKSLQESFTCDAELTEAQYVYAALDTRLPLAIRTIQMLILRGETFASLKDKNDPAAKYLQHLDPFVTGDNLVATAQLENDAIGAFQDMHVHGERLDRQKWRERIVERKRTLGNVINGELDPIFIPIVGKKSDTVTDEQVAEAEAKWKSYNSITPEETALKPLKRKAKGNLEELAKIVALEDALKAKRVAVKETHKAACSALKRRRTVIKNLAEKCEGEALINYASGAQVRDVLVGLPGLKGLKDTDDESLETFASVPAVAAFRKYRTLSKEIKTYGDQWTQEWVTKPCKEEGWLHPGDGRLHCVFNQYDAETGRSSSEQPNAQNLPRDKEVRACFIADPPDESIRISVCCGADTTQTVACTNHGSDQPCNVVVTGYLCSTCGMPCDTKPEEYVIVTADMSGAELRILADLANDPVWIGAFNRGEDVHSVCTELIEGEAWARLALPDCAYYQFKPDGSLQRKKCKCPEHNELRDGMKPTNFGIPYGISDRALAVQIRKTLDATRELMGKHKQRFPRIWAYVDHSGTMAKLTKKSFDIFGRRRLFPEPTWERATQKAKEDRAEKLLLPDDEQARNKANFIALNGRKPTPEEKWILTHRLPSNKEVANAYKAMHGSIERQGKNHEIQGSNASIAKKAMGSGYCPDGKPYLWHTLPQYKAKLLKMVHDELVVQAPKRFAETVAALIGDAFKRAAAERMKRVTMEFDYNIATYWKK